MFRPHGKLESVYKSGLIAVLFRLVFIGEGVPMRNRWPLVALCLALTVIMLRKLGVQMMRLDGDLSVYYHSANELTSGQTPYYAGTHYIYPPLFAWLIAPFAILSPVGYAIAWGLLLGACWVASVILVRRLTGDQGWLVDVVPSVLLFRAIWNGWGHGQVSLLMSAMLLAFLVLERERKLIQATFWLAFAGALKVFPFYMGVVLLAPGNFRYIPVLGVWTLALTVLPALTHGMQFLYSLVVDGFFGWGMARINAEHGLIVNHAPVPHLFQVLGIDSHGALKVALLVCMVVVTALVLIARRPREERERDNLYLSFALTSCLMVCPHVWMHYFTLLLLPVAAALVFIRNHRGSFETRVLTAGLVVSGLAFNAGSKLLVSTATSAWCDEIGVAAVGLFALWLALAVVVVRRGSVAVPAEKPGIGLPDSGLSDVSLA